MSETTKTKPQYCCIWCHEPVPASKAYVTTRGSIVCEQHKGLGAVVNKWNKPCKRRHSVNVEKESEGMK